MKECVGSLLAGGRGRRRHDRRGDRAVRRSTGLFQYQRADRSRHCSGKLMRCAANVWRRFYCHELP